MLAVLGESFFYFSSATFVCFITGNAFAMPALYALLHFLAVLLDWLISSFAQGFIFGFSTNYTGAVEWLSPTVYLAHNIQPLGTYEEVTQAYASGTYTEHVLTSVELENFWLVGVYALAGLALAALALVLYRSRRSETAGDVVAVGWLRPVFRYGVAGLCALLGASCSTPCSGTASRPEATMTPSPWWSAAGGWGHRVLRRLHAAGQVPEGVPGQLEGAPGRAGRVRPGVLHPAL